MASCITPGGTDPAIREGRYSYTKHQESGITRSTSSASLGEPKEWTYVGCTFHRHDLLASSTTNSHIDSHLLCIDSPSMSYDRNDLFRRYRTADEAVPSGLAWTDKDLKDYQTR